MQRTNLDEEPDIMCWKPIPQYTLDKQLQYLQMYQDLE